MATEAEIAWAAGLFEGEGCISWVFPPGRAGSLPSPRLAICSTDLDVLEKFQAVIGCGAISKKTRRTLRHKPQSQWYTAKWEDVSRALGLLLPFLCERRAEKAMEVLERCHLARERACATCGRLFVARMEKAMYCSKQCGWHATRAKVVS